MGKHQELMEKERVRWKYQKLERERGGNGKTPGAHGEREGEVEIPKAGERER